NSAAFDFFSERPLEMIVAPPRRFMKESTEPLNAFLIARSAFMVAEAYFAPASAARPFPLTPAAFASLAKSAFHASNPALVLPQLAAACAPAVAANTAAIAVMTIFPLAKN